MKTMKILSAVILTLMFTTSCSKNDDTVVVQEQQQQAGEPSDLVYNDPQTEVAFYSTGSTAAPNVNWNGETGSFMSNGSYDGITINSNTGVISWNKNLPLGENYISVRATNSKGSSVTQVILNNQFQGNFIGGYNYDPTSTILTDYGLTMNFASDETMLCVINGSTGAGSWNTISGSYISVNFILAGDPVTYKFEGEVVYSNSILPYIAGSYGIAGAGVWMGHMRLDIF